MILRKNVVENDPCLFFGNFYRTNITKILKNILARISVCTVTCKIRQIWLVWSEKSSQKIGKDHSLQVVFVILSMFLNMKVIFSHIMTYVYMYEHIWTVIICKLIKRGNNETRLRKKIQINFFGRRKVPKK